MADSFFNTNLLFFQRSVYKQKLFSATKLPNLINKNTKQFAFGKKPGVKYLSSPCIMSL